MPPTELNVQRVRHPLKMRLLEVKRVTRPTPHLARITLAGDALRDFVSASFDDHVKVFFPPPGAARPVLPELGPDPVIALIEVADPAARLALSTRAQASVQWLLR
ncbi:siderophore-interacting protein, partial [Bordetella pertussis]|uniref:siderophore-interacting protein n=1 Tax=Bordetella pertussis TaxID=520 RepID=UPI0018A6BF4D